MSTEIVFPPTPEKLSELLFPVIPGTEKNPKKKKRKKKKSKKSWIIFCLKAGGIGLGVTTFVVYSLAVAAADPNNPENWVYV